jgi:hypothetical protein
MYVVELYTFFKKTGTAHTRYGMREMIDYLKSSSPGHNLWSETVPSSSLTTLANYYFRGEWSKGSIWSAGIQKFIGWLFWKRDNQSSKQNWKRQPFWKKLCPGFSIFRSPHKYETTDMWTLQGILCTEPLT